MRLFLLLFLLFGLQIALAQDPSKSELAPCGTPPGIAPMLQAYRSNPGAFITERSSDTLLVGMQLHLLAQNNGTGRISPERLLDSYCRLNADFAGTGIRFYSKFDWNRIDSTAWYQHDTISKGIDSRFYALGWEEKKFSTSISIDGVIRESPTHKVDCFKGRVALELEWNNKDPFFDRDLNNFRLLFDLGAIDVGVIVPRASELQGIFNSLGKGKSYGNSTTHHEKLWPRLDGGGGGGCPVLTFAITPELYVDDGPPTEQTLQEMGVISPDEDAEA